MNRDELHQRLRAAADSPAPGADPAFAAALEQRLRAVHHSLPDDLPGRLPGATEPRPDAASPAPGRPWFRSPAPVAAALAVLALLSVPLLLRPPADPALQLVAAYDTQVTLPDGRRVTARPGLVLEEGAILLTGPRGHVEAGGLVLGSGEVAVVQDGRLHRVERTAARPTTEPSPAARPAATAAPGGPLETLPLLPAPSARPARPDPESSTRPADQSPAQDEATAKPSPGEEAAQAGKAPPDERHAIGVAAWAEKGVVRLSWTAFAHPDFALFAVLRAPYPAVPTWPTTEGTEVVGYSPDPEQRQFTDDDLDYRPVYRVVALDRSGHELGRSRAVTPAFDRAAARPMPQEAEPASATD